MGDRLGIPRALSILFENFQLFSDAEFQALFCCRAIIPLLFQLKIVFSNQSQNWRLKIFFILKKIENFFKSQIWLQNRYLRLRFAYRNIKFISERRLFWSLPWGRVGSGNVYIGSLGRHWKFTHPIFESDFDCLTGKNRLHAQLSPIPSRLR